MLTKYSLLLLLFATNFLLTNPMEKGKSVTEIKKNDQSEFPQYSQQSQQQFVGLENDKAKEIAFPHPQQITAYHDIGMPADAYEQLQYIQSHHPIHKQISSHSNEPFGTNSDLPPLPEQISYEYSPRYSPFHQPMDNHSELDQQFMHQLLSDLVMSSNFVDHQQHFNQGFDQLNQPHFSNLKSYLSNKIGNELVEGNTGENQATQHGLPFSGHQQLESAGKIAGFQQPQGIGGNDGILKSDAGKNQAKGQLFLGIGGSLLTSEQNDKLHKGQNALTPEQIVRARHHGMGGGIQGSASNAEESGSRKYTYHQMLGKVKSNVKESNKELGGSEYNRQIGDRIHKKLPHKTRQNAEMRLRLLPPSRLGMSEGELQKMSYHKPADNDMSGIESAGGNIPPWMAEILTQKGLVEKQWQEMGYSKPADDMTGIESSDNMSHPHSMQHVIPTEHLLPPPPVSAGDTSEGSSVKSESRKRKHKDDSISIKEGSSKSNPIDIDKIDSKQQKELFPPHSSQSQIAKEEHKQIVKDTDEVTESLSDHHHDDFIKRNKFQH